MSKIKRSIIAIEDDTDILDVIVYNLEREGFDVRGFTDGESGFAAVCSRQPDLVVLDLMLPGIDGLEICRSMRADPRTSGIPVIMVTAKSEESDVVLGLGIGADDYVGKPFRPRELIARVKVLLRRSRGGAAAVATTVIEADGVAIDVNRHKVTVDGCKADLTATEFRLLHYLASHPGIVFSRDQIIANVIADGAIVIDRNIDVHVRAVRKKLAPHADLIETVRGVGYRFRET
ncbi:MAG: response regulator [Planctomycetota bacterium]